MTKRIVLDFNLKYIVEALTLVQRGELLTALFNQQYQGSDVTIKNVYQYVASLQDEQEKKRLHMKDISLKGVAARLKNQASDNQAVDRRLKRKVAKENRDFDIKNNSSFDFSCWQEKNRNEKFVPPSTDEVQAFIDEHHLNVAAKTFVDFYEVRGWKVGRQPMCSWQAMLRLWHERALKNPLKSNEQSFRAMDGTYWHQLAQKFAVKTADEGILHQPLANELRQNLPEESRQQPDLDLSLKPFTRFMKRVEKYDIETENEHDGKQ